MFTHRVLFFESFFGASVGIIRVEDDDISTTVHVASVHVHIYAYVVNVIAKWPLTHLENPLVN